MSAVDAPARPGEAVRAAGDDAADRPLHVAYVMSRFPKLTETFVLSEILAMERAGVQVSVWPLLRERAEVLQPGAAEIVARAHYLPFLSPSILRSQLRYLRDARRRRRYVRALLDMLAGTWRSPNFLLGGIGIFPKVAHAALAMREAGVDHVHCHFANHPALAGFLVHRLAGIPYSFTAHGSDLHVDRTMLPAKVAEAAFVVTISEDNRRLIEETSGPGSVGRVGVIHCGVDPERFRPVERPTGGPLRIVSVGTLHEVKGQVHLVDACARLAARGVPFRCRFIGDGPDREMLAARIGELGLADHVELVGRRTSDEVARELAEADVLVAPSVPTRSGKREGIPVVLMEAMATGLPVVASRLSGIPELVADGSSGLLVPPGDPDALADALARLAGDDALRSRLGAAGRETVLRDFDVDRNARELSARIRTSLGRATSAAATAGAGPAR